MNDPPTLASETMIPGMRRSITPRMNMSAEKSIPTPLKAFGAF
jgi:hypothetical protein